MVIPRVEIARNSVNASPGRGVRSVALEPDQRDLSGNFEGLQMIISSKINSYTDFNGFDETRGNITVEGGDLTVNEKKTLTAKHTLITISLLPQIFWYQNKSVKVYLNFFSYPMRDIQLNSRTY